MLAPALQALGIKNTNMIPTAPSISGVTRRSRNSDSACGADAESPTSAGSVPAPKPPINRAAEATLPEAAAITAAA